MGPMRAARLFALELGEAGLLDRVASVRAELYGSLALTGIGHGTDRAVLLGLSGEEASTIDPATVRGTGPGGRIVQDDILALVSRPAAPAQNSLAPRTAPSSAPAMPSRVATGQKQVIPFNKMRQTIALRLQQSKQQIPHFYETIDVDVEAISRSREKLNKQLESEGVRLSKKEMKPVEARLQRSAALPKYDITIKPQQSVDRQVA